MDHILDHFLDHKPDHKPVCPRANILRVSDFARGRHVSLMGSLVSIRAIIFPFFGGQAFDDDSVIRASSPLDDGSTHS